MAWKTAEVLYAGCKLQESLLSIMDVNPRSAWPNKWPMNGRERLVSNVSRLLCGCSLIASSSGLTLQNIELPERLCGAVCSTSILDFGLPIQLCRLLSHLPELREGSRRVSTDGNKSGACRNGYYLLCSLYALSLGLCRLFIVRYRFKLGFSFSLFFFLGPSAIFLVGGFFLLFQYLLDRSEPLPDGSKIASHFVEQLMNMDGQIHFTDPRAANRDNRCIGRGFQYPFN